MRQPRLLVATLLACGATAAGAAVPHVTYAQRLANLTSFSHPDLLGVTIAAAPPESNERQIFGAEPGRLTADRPAVPVVGTGFTERAVYSHPKDHSRCTVTLPLRDVKDATVGVLVIASKCLSDALAEPRAIERATGIRNQLQGVIPGREELFDVYDMGFEANDALAQRLMIGTALRHPEVLVLAMHLKAPGEKDFKIWATNRPLIRNTVETDQRDPDVGERGQSLFQLFGPTHRMLAELPLRAQDGSVCGALVVLNLWQDEKEMPGFMAQAMAVRDELQLQIPSHAALFKP